MEASVAGTGGRLLVADLPTLIVPTRAPALAFEEMVSNFSTAAAFELFQTLTDKSSLATTSIEPPPRQRVCTNLITGLCKGNGVEVVLSALGEG